jgi:hypothetical protein
MVYSVGIESASDDAKPQSMERLGKALPNKPTNHVTIYVRSDAIIHTYITTYTIDPYYHCIIMPFVAVVCFSHVPLTKTGSSSSILMSKDSGSTSSKSSSSNTTSSTTSTNTKVSRSVASRGDDGINSTTLLFRRRRARERRQKRMTAATREFIAKQNVSTLALAYYNELKQKQLDRYRLAASIIPRGRAEAAAAAVMVVPNLLELMSSYLHFIDLVRFRQVSHSACKAVTTFVRAPAANGGLAQRFWNKLQCDKNTRPFVDAIKEFQDEIAAAGMYNTHNITISFRIINVINDDDDDDE